MGSLGPGQGSRRSRRRVAWCRRWRQAGVPWAGLGLAGAWGDPAGAAGALGNCPRRACPSRAGGSPSCRCSRRAWLSSLSSRWRSSKGWSRWANLRSKMPGNSTINCSSSASWPRLCSSSWRAAARAAASSGDGASAGLGVLPIPGDGLFAGGGCSAGDGCSTGESWSTGEGWSVGDGCSRGPGDRNASNLRQVRDPLEADRAAARQAQGQPPAAPASRLAGPRG